MKLLLNVFANIPGTPGDYTGGVICALIDAAMTHCLFNQGFVAVTVDLSVRFRHPVKLNQSVIVRAWISRERSVMHVLQAELLQEDQIKVTGSGKFFDQPDLYQSDRRFEDK